MATTVGPSRNQADNSADRCSIAQNVWLSVRRFHVGTSATTLTPDGGYTTATDSRVELLNGVSLLALREGAIYAGLGITDRNLNAAMVTWAPLLRLIECSD